MQELVSNVRLMLLVTSGLICFSFFTGFFLFLVTKIKNTDYSDQSGWKNFSKPFLSCALIFITLQLIVFGIVAAYFLF